MTTFSDSSSMEVKVLKPYSPSRRRRRIPPRFTEWSTNSHQGLLLLPWNVQHQDDGSTTGSLRHSAMMIRPPPPPPPPPPPHHPPSPPHPHVHKSFSNDTEFYNSSTSFNSNSNFDSSGWFPWYYNYNTYSSGSGSSHFSFFNWFHDRESNGHRRTSSSSSAPPFMLQYYVQFLGWSLMAWIAYLFIPKGWRKSYCHADRRRHKRHRQVALLPSHKRTVTSNGDSYGMRSPSPPLSISVPRIHLDPKKDSQAEDPKKQLFQQNYQYHEPQLDEFSHSLVSLMDDSQYSLSQGHHRGIQEGNFRYHPSIPIAPSQKILRDTFSRLEHAGIRLMAHGIQCDSKRVWIRVVADSITSGGVKRTFSLKWQTEVSQSITSLDGRTSQIWVKRGGAAHTLPLNNVLCVDVGKNTSALARKTELDPNTCFSLLTPTGSLDLQARSQLERDAVVCCFARLLDEVHEVDWRNLYQESPEPSTITSVFQSSAAVAFAESSVDSSFL